MNKCIVCNKNFEPPKSYNEKKTCSKECFQIYMKTKPSKKFLDNSFTKGRTPFNKGIPQKEWMSTESIEKCKETYIQNQKNCKSPLSDIENRYLPHNTLSKGTVTRRLIKHTQGKNKGKTEVVYYINIDWHGNRKPNNLLKRYIWEVHHQQDVPKGMVIYCIDGNPENFDIDNLELITRAELLKRNGSCRY